MTENIDGQSYGTVPEPKTPRSLAERTLNSLRRFWHWFRWIKNPKWWSVVLAGIQVILLGVVGTVLNQRDKEQSRTREIASLDQNLADANPKVYEFAAKGLIEQTEKARVINYSMHVECMPWQKARFLYATIVRASEDREDRKQALNMLWSSWLCHQHDLGINVQLYETLKSAPESNCESVTENLGPLLEKVDHRLDEMFANETLYVVLRHGCPKSVSPELRAFEEQIRVDFKKYSEELVTFAYPPYTPWVPDREVAIGSVVAKDESWHDVFWQTYRTFSKAGPEGTNVVAAQVAREPLLSRLIISQYLIRPGGDADKSMVSAIKPRVHSWIELGLHSLDKECRYAAVSAVGTLELKEFRNTLLTMAQSDQDADVRRRALQVLSETFGF